MKNYFDITLTGKKFFPIWLIFYLIVIVPYALSYKSLVGHSQGSAIGPIIGIVFLVIIIAAFFISFYIIKITIEHIKYGDNQLAFNGKFSTYIGKILLGFLLSIITLSIYMAWFIRDISKFIIDSSSAGSTNFQFNGKGGKLFLILLLTLYIPIGLLAFLMGKYLMTINQNFLFACLYQVVVIIILIPYMYYVYKWMIDVTYKGYHVKWQTTFASSCGKFFIEILLSIVTAGIYLPLAYLRMYKYFTDRTIAEKDDGDILRFGYDLEQTNDFLFVWGQILLTVITIGIYYPWAYVNIGKRVLSKTYVTSDAA